MPRFHPRVFTVQQTFDHGLMAFMDAEAMQLLARCTARIMARDRSRYSELAKVFAAAMNEEFRYLTNPAKHQRGAGVS